MEQKILAELDSLELLKSSTRVTPRELTYADLSKLTYLNSVIKVLAHRLPVMMALLASAPAPVPVRPAVLHAWPGALRSPRLHHKCHCS